MTCANNPYTIIRNSTLSGYQKSFSFLPNIVAIKLFLLPIFFAFSALKSATLLVFEIGGTGGSGGVTILSLDGGVGMVGVICSSRFGRLLPFFVDLRLRILCLLFLDTDKLCLTLTPFSSAICLSSSSIAPASVIPPVAKFSSGMGTNFMSPLSGATPKLSSIDFARSAAFLLFVTGCNCDWTAVIVIVYAGSKLPA